MAATVQSKTNYLTVQGTAKGKQLKTFSKDEVSKVIDHLQAME
jgi:hypothetical protein